MAKLVIKGNFTPGHAPVIEEFRLEGDCQTCAGAFEISIPYDLHAQDGTVEHVISKASAAAGGARKITASS